MAAPEPSRISGTDYRRDEPPTRQKAIRMFCLECQSGVQKDVRECQLVDCPLWSYRLGRGHTHDPEGRVTHRKGGAKT